MKNIKIVFLLIMLFVPKIVLAGTFNANFSPAKCIDNKSCILLCGYNVDYDSSDNFQDDAYIFYLLDEKKFKVVWGTEFNATKAQFSGDSYDYKWNFYDNKKIFKSDEAYNGLVNDGKCPTNAYADYSGISKELCLDNGNSYCLQEANNIGTKFKGTSTLVYNYNDHLKNYFQNDQTGTIDLSPKFTSCDQLKNFDFESLLVTDISTNFLYGNPMPTFIKNSSSYKTGKLIFQTQTYQFIDKCINDVNNDSSLTQAQKEQLISQYKNAKGEVSQQVQDSQEQIDVGTKTNNKLNIDFNKIGKIDCEDDQTMPETVKFLQKAFDLIKIIAPILVLVFGSLDYAKVVFADKDDELKKAGQRFIKRLIAAVIIFILPALLTLIINVTGLNTTLCGIK